MKVKVIGSRKLDFETQNGSVRGTQIFVTYPTDGVNGEIADKVFVPASSRVVIPALTNGKVYDFVYEGLGKRQSLTAIVPIN